MVQTKTENYQTKTNLVTVRQAPQQASVIAYNAYMEHLRETAVLHTKKWYKQKAASAFGDQPTLMANISRLAEILEACDRNALYPKAREAVSMEDKMSLYFQQNAQCIVCGKKMKVSECSIEHLIPFSLVGDYLTNNLAVSHQRCNELKGDKPLFNFVL